MPRQDPQGRWISDDRLQYWDGTAWRPLGVRAPGGATSALPVILIGCGFVAVVCLVIAIVVAILHLQQPGLPARLLQWIHEKQRQQRLPFPPRLALI